MHAENEAISEGLRGRREEIAEATPSIAIRNVSKTFRRTGGEVVRAVDDVSLEVAPGEFVVLLGPSGCGKTTLLRCIAGLEHPHTGDIEIDGALVASSPLGRSVPPEKRNVGMMFQSYALWPHMTVSRNVAYPLESRKLSKRRVKDDVADILHVVGIEGLGGQYPSQLSGGQQQRVALARSLVGRPKGMLFDEPLSNVDAKVRQQLRLELVAMQHKLKFAAIYVTHDQDEAMQLADRVAVMDQGRIVQIGPPRSVYQQPKSRYVAGFVGAANEWGGKFRSRSDSGRPAVVVEGLGEVYVAEDGVADGVAEGDLASVIVRPEEVSISTLRPRGCGVISKGRIAQSIFCGNHTEYVVATDGGRSVRVWSADRAPLAAGTRVWLSVDASFPRVFAETTDEV